MRFKLEEDIPQHIQEALEAIDPYRDHLEQIVNDAFDLLGSGVTAEVRASICARTQASLISDLARHIARSLETECQWKVCENENKTQWWISIDTGDHHVCLLFKKMDSDGLCRNISTERNRALTAQVSLPGLGDSARFRFGYVLDDTLRDRPEEMLLAYPDSERSNAWFGDLQRSVAAARPTQTTIHHAPAAPAVSTVTAQVNDAAPAPRRAVVRVKGQKDDRQHRDSESGNDHPGA